MVKRLVEQKKLTYVLPKEMEQLKSVHAFYESKPYQDPKIKAFIDFLHNRKSAINDNNLAIDIIGFNQS